MYSKTFYNIYWAISLLLTHVGVTSIHFDRNKRICYITNKSRKKCLTLCWTSTIFALHGTSKSIYMLKYEGGYANKDFLIAYSFAFIEILMCGGLILVNLRQDDIVTAFNWFLNYVRQFQSTYLLLQFKFFASF